MILIPKIGYDSLPTSISDLKVLQKIKTLRKYDKENNKINIKLKHWGIVINNFIYIAKAKNLFRLKNTDWVYYPRINILYNEIISNNIEKYYKTLKNDMKKKDYKYANKNIYNKTHTKLLKNGGNEYYK